MPRYRDRFEEFVPYVQREMEDLGDETVAQERGLLRTLADYDNA